MGEVILTLEVLPESPDTDLEKIKNEAAKIIERFSGRLEKSEVQPIAFGLKKLVIYLTIPEADFNEEQFIEAIQNIEGVNSAEITNVTRKFF